MQAHVCGVAITVKIVRSTALPLTSAGQVRTEERVPKQAACLISLCYLTV